MKTFIAIALVVVSICAGSQSNPTFADDSSKAGQRLLVASIVESQIEEIIQQLQDSGLDPLTVESAEFNYNLPVASLFSTDAHANGFEFSGVSNIVINNINYGLLTSRLTFDISLPEIIFAIDEAALDIGILGGKIAGNIGGRTAIKDINVSGNVVINIGIITGVSVRSLALNFSLGGISSDLNVSWLGKDRTDLANNLLGTRIPNAIASHKADINEYLEIIAWQVINSAGL